jgi:hypothetical protein
VLKTDSSLTKKSLLLFCASSHTCNLISEISGTGSYGINEMFRRHGMHTSQGFVVGNDISVSLFSAPPPMQAPLAEKEAKRYQNTPLPKLCGLLCLDASHKLFSCDLLCEKYIVLALLPNYSHYIGANASNLGAGCTDNKHSYCAAQLLMFLISRAADHRDPYKDGTTTMCILCRESSGCPSWHGYLRKAE